MRGRIDVVVNTKKGLGYFGWDVAMDTRRVLMCVAHGGHPDCEFCSSFHSLSHCQSKKVNNSMPCLVQTGYISSFCCQCTVRMSLTKVSCTVVYCLLWCTLHLTIWVMFFFVSLCVRTSAEGKVNNFRARNITAKNTSG